jgi:hypothetical protein
MSVVYIAACVVVPIIWGAAVHWLFASWHARQAAPHAVVVHDAEAEEPNVP